MEWTYYIKWNPAEKQMDTLDYHIFLNGCWLMAGSLGISVCWRVIFCPNSSTLPGGSLYSMSGQCGILKRSRPLLWFRSNLKGQTISQAIFIWNLCYKCITVQLLPLFSCALFHPFINTVFRSTSPKSSSIEILVPQSLLPGECDWRLFLL